MFSIRNRAESGLAVDVEVPEDRTRDLVSPDGAEGDSEVEEPYYRAFLEPGSLRG